MGRTGPDEQAHYNHVVETQLTELWSNYGKLFELWFDGGVLPAEQGGPQIIPLMRRFQPDAVVFGGPVGWPSLARFVGNERGEAPDPFWNTTSNLEAFDGTAEVVGLGGSPDGDVWSGGESDMPNRCQLKAFQGGWFWRADEDHLVHSLDHLIERYFSSVARNTNLLLGMVIDPRGLVPEVDRARFAEFGERISTIFSRPVARISGTGTVLTLPLPNGRTPSVLGLMEDIRHGERVRSFVVEARTPVGWITLWRGTCIGHQRVERFDPLTATELRLRIMGCVAEPLIREFAAWEADPTLFSVPMDAARRATPAIRRNREGMVTITCPDPNLSLRYTCDGSEPDATSPIYHAPFPLRDGGTAKTSAFLNERSSSVTVTAVFGIDRSTWSVVSVSLDSPFANDGHAGVAHLLNDDPDSYWHTFHTDKSKSAAPHHVVMDMGRTLAVSAFTMLPRGGEGVPDRYEFHLSQDGVIWTLAAAGNFTGLRTDPNLRLVELGSPISARYLRFVAIHVLDDVDYVVVAGIGVITATS